MRKSIAAAIIAASTATSACGHMHNEGAGPTVSRSYQVGNFDKIEVAGPYEVSVRTGANATVSAEGSEKLLEKTVVEVKGDKLVIRPQDHHGFFSWGWGNGGKANFTVTVPQLSGATIAGSGDIRVDHVRGNQFEGEVAGSGGLNVDSLEVGSLKLSIGGSGSAKAGAGKAQSAEYSIAGLGRYRRRRGAAAAGEGLHRGLGQREGALDRDGRRQHHGLRGRRCLGRGEMLGEQAGLRRRTLLLKAF